MRLRVFEERESMEDKNSCHCKSGSMHHVVVKDRDIVGEDLERRRPWGLVDTYLGHARDVNIIIGSSTKQISMARALHAALLHFQFHDSGEHWLAAVMHTLRTHLMSIFCTISKSPSCLLQILRFTSPSTTWPCSSYILAPVCTSRADPPTRMRMSSP